MILGRAVAGNWHSAHQTVSDFLARGWPALILWGIAVLLDVLSRPTPERPAPDRLLFGILPGLLFIAAGIGCVIMQGPWR